MSSENRVPTGASRRSFVDLGAEIGALVEEKDKAYGNAFDLGGRFLSLLYPTGILPEQYDDMLGLVRLFDKQKRIATDRDALGEDPWRDVVGYGLLGAARVERRRAERRASFVVNGTCQECGLNLSDGGFHRPDCKVPKL